MSVPKLFNGGNSVAVTTKLKFTKNCFWTIYFKLIRLQSNFIYLPSQLPLNLVEYQL